MNQIIYPRIDLVEGRVVPKIYLPKKFKELVPGFYQQKRELKIEDYAKALNSVLNARCPPINLTWHEDKGLSRIQIGPKSSLDLSESDWPSFQENNLPLDYVFYAFSVGQKYVSELMKS